MSSRLKISDGQTPSSNKREILASFGVKPSMSLPSWAHERFARQSAENDNGKREARRVG